MQIAILNQYFLEREHLGTIEKEGKIIFPRRGASIRNCIQDAEIIIVDPFITLLDTKVLDSAKKLKYIVTTTTSTEMLPMDYLLSRKIRVSNVPSYAANAVAESSIGMMLALTRKIVEINSSVREKLFVIDPAKPKQRELLTFELKNKTLGIIGLGKIGMKVARYAKCLGLNVIAYNRSKKNVRSFKQLPLETVLKRSDIISLNLAVNSETIGFLSKKRLDQIKPGAYLINLASDKLVDQNALYKALKSRKIAGAALEVFPEWKNDNPLLKLDNVIFTALTAWYTKEALENMAETVVSNITNYAKR